MQRWAAVLLLIAGAGAPRVQAQANTVPFKRLTPEDGLSQSAVHAIVQDRRGFLWIGTQDGLNRYDGYRFSVYQHDALDSLSLSANWITALCQGRNGALWIGTYGGGLNRFDPATARFTRYRHRPDDPNSLAHDVVSAIYEDASGIVWIGTYGGLSRFDPATARFQTYRHDPDDPNSLRSDRALVLAEDGDGALWIGTDRGGLNRLDPATEQFTAYLHDPDDPNSPSANVVLALHTDRAGRLWIGTAGGGLNRLDPGAGRFIHFRHDPADPHSLSNDRILSIYEDADGALWAGTDGGGLNRLDPDTRRFTRFRHDPADLRSLSNDVVSALYEDRSGTLWAGTTGGGLNKKLRFLRYKHQAGAAGSLPNNPLLAIHEDRNGTLWVGTDGGGLSRLDPASGRFTTYTHTPTDPNSLAHDRVLDVTEDQEGRLWIATGDGLDRLDPATGRFAHYRHDPRNTESLSNNRIFVVYEAPSEPDVLWIGTWGGLHRFDPATGRATRFYHDPADTSSLSNDRVIAIHESRDGALWVGTFGGGLNRMDRATGRVVRFRQDPGDRHSLSHNIVASIYEDTGGTLWIGTGEGFNRYDRATGTFTRFAQRDGLPNNTVYGILEDARGGLWLSTNKGLSRFDPATETFVNYDVSDGLPSNEFSQGAYHKSRSGELFFGGIDGLTRFHPDRLQNAAPPPIVLTAFSAGQEAEDTLPAGTQAVTLVREDAFSFEFAALDFANPARNRYAFMLDGLDADWHYRDADRRFAAYSNLEGGTYTLRVRGADAGGVWNDAGTTLAITVVPPFWETIWFRLLTVTALLGIVGGMAYAWHRVRIRRVERMRDERAEIQRQLTESREAERLHLAQELHDGAVQDLYGVRFSLESLTEEKDAETVTQGKAMVQDVIQKLRVICGELRPPALAPFGLERAIRSHAERFQEAYPDVVIDLDLRPDGQTLPDAMRLALYRVYQEAMNNIAKHAEARHVRVRLHLDDGHVVLAVQDDGRGFVLPARWIELGREAHYGLLGISERADALGGRLEVEAAPGQGTTVRVVVPHPSLVARGEAPMHNR